ncbi:MAG: rod shape-determining protein RodA [Clostridia bacterium]|jgi:rod shape determining protein RodA|nr:rod shape-determining protein RodA [Clostridia bacterium]
MKNRILKNIEWGILICCILLLIIGATALYSATQETNYDELKRQITWIIISIPVIIVVIIIDYNIIAKFSPIFYGIFIILLIAVLFTPVVNGATSWFTITEGIKLQPSEFAKIFVIILLSYIISKIQEKGREEINHPLKLLGALTIAIVPVLLIIKQPDYGTALAFMTAAILILFTAGLSKKYILATVLIVAIALPLIYFFILPSHAKTRIDVFLNPNLDPRGSGYNVIQSKLAVGSGQLLGMGLLKGNQTQLGFLHPKTTDFIFSVIGEEMGFIVAGLVIILYVILITKSVYVAKTAKDDIGSYIAIGIVGIFLFHMIENIGMTMGLLPITGVPLPFVSYGGSSLVTNFICIGLLLNISGRRQKKIFVD